MFRFTIRDLLWLMVVVAMGAGWFISNVSANAEQAMIWREAMLAREEMQEAANSAGYRFVLGTNGLTLEPKPGLAAPHQTTTTPPTPK